jgi:thioredoxin reductase (NADPH)
VISVLRHRDGVHSTRERLPAIIVGGGPCGLAAAIAMQRAGIENIILERSCLVSGIVSYPIDMTFFSTAEKIAIGDIPFVVSTAKPTRRDALSYYRGVAQHYGVRIRQYETVERISRQADSRWEVQSRTRGGETQITQASAVVMATGYFGRPNRLGVPGEDLPHVSFRFSEGHQAWDQDVVVVGGANSAVDAALELHRAGARVTMVHFAAGLDTNVKPWVRPDIDAKIRDGAITAHFNARVVAIAPDRVTISVNDSLAIVPAQHVFTMLGYMPETSLLESVKAPIDQATGIPTHDATTMETPLAGLFIAGVLASGFDANKTFIENGRFHGDLIAARILSQWSTPVAV